MSATPEQLIELAERATPGPWLITEDRYDGKAEAWCHWHEVGPFVLTGESPDDDSNFVAAANPAVVAQMCKELIAARKVCEAARGLRGGQDWNNGTHAKFHGYRAKLIAASEAYDQAAQNGAQQA